MDETEIQRTHPDDGVLTLESRSGKTGFHFQPYIALRTKRTPTCARSSGRAIGGCTSNQEAGPAAVGRTERLALPPSPDGRPIAATCPKCCSAVSTGRSMSPPSAYTISGAPGGPIPNGRSRSSSTAGIRISANRRRTLLMPLVPIGQANRLRSLRRRCRLVPHRRTVSPTPSGRSAPATGAPAASAFPADCARSPTPAARKGMLRPVVRTRSDQQFVRRSGASIRSGCTISTGSRRRRPTSVPFSISACRRPGTTSSSGCPACCAGTASAG